MKFGFVNALGFFFSRSNGNGLRFSNYFQSESKNLQTLLNVNFIMILIYDYQGTQLAVRNPSQILAENLMFHDKRCCIVSHLSHLYTFTGKEDPILDKKERLQ